MKTDIQDLVKRDCQHFYLEPIETFDEENNEVYEAELSTCQLKNKDWLYDECVNCKEYIKEETK